MSRLSPSHLVTLAALLVALTLGVVLFAELPAIMMTPATPAVPSPAPTTTPASSNGAPGAYTAIVSTSRFTLSVPDAFRVKFVGSTSVALKQVGAQPMSTNDPDYENGIVVSVFTSSGISSAEEQSIHLEELRGKGSPPLPACVPPTRVTVGGVDGTLTGYLYTNDSGIQVCDAFWTGTKSSGPALYEVQYAAAQTGYPGFAAQAAPVLGSITWAR